MVADIYHNHGIRFAFPANWELSEQPGEGELNLTVTSPETSFLTVAVMYTRPDPRLVMKTVLAALREEYPDLDVYRAKVRLCGRPTLARDLQFFCRELVNSAWVRTFRTPSSTVLVLYQATDHELEESARGFETVLNSLTFEDLEARETEGEE